MRRLARFLELAKSLVAGVAVPVSGGVIVVGRCMEERGRRGRGRVGSGVKVLASLGDLPALAVAETPAQQPCFRPPAPRPFASRPKLVYLLTCRAPTWPIDSPSSRMIDRRIMVLPAMAGHPPSATSSPSLLSLVLAQLSSATWKSCPFEV